MPYVELAWNANTPLGIKTNQSFYIKSVYSGYFLDVDNSNTANGTTAIQYSLNGGSNQQFRFVSSAYAGYYRIVPQNATNKCLILNTSNVVVLSDDCSSDRALWRFVRENNGSYYILNKYNENYLALSGTGCASGDSLTYQTSATARCKWEIQPRIFVANDNLIPSGNTYRNRIMLSQQNYYDYSQAYFSGQISESCCDLFLQQVTNYADEARAEYAILNPNSSYRSTISVRTLSYSSSNPMVGLDVIMLQKALFAAGFLDMPVERLYGTYDSETVEAYKDWQIENGYGYQLPPEYPNSTLPPVYEANGIANVDQFNTLMEQVSKTVSQNWFDTMREYSGQHRAVQTLLATTFGAKIEVRISGMLRNGNRPSYGFADILAKTHDNGTEVWEVKHKSQYSVGPTGTGKRQLEKYITAINNDPNVPQTPISSTDPTYKVAEYTRTARAGNGFTSFFMPYADKYLLVEYDFTAPGVVLYHAYEKDEKDQYKQANPNVQEVSNGQAVEVITNAYSTLLITGIGMTVVVIAGVALSVVIVPASVSTTTTVVIINIAAYAAQQVIGQVA